MVAHTHTPVLSSKDAMVLEDRFGAHNYKPLPVVISKAKGINVWDPEGRHYYDFLSAYSALNQGHCHDRLLKVAHEQLEKVTLTSRAFYNDELGTAEQFLAETFGFDKTLMMNSGVEAVETSLKLARRWGYDKKGIPENKAVIIAATGNFHGRTLGIISFSTDASAKKGFGPFLPGAVEVPYNNTDALEVALQDHNVCAFIVEPIQGEAGVVLPTDGYLTKVRELCSRYNVLMIADEIQTGLGRTGKMLCCDNEGVKPDILTLGKALSGGIMPISAVLANDDVMLNIKPGEHGSTFGGNPLASAITVEAVKIIIDEKLCENAMTLGEVFRQRMHKIKSPIIKEIRGKGLFNAIEFTTHEHENIGYKVSLALMKNGLLAKETHGNIIRFAPPLIIDENQLSDCCDIIQKTIEALV